MKPEFGPRRASFVGRLHRFLDAFLNERGEGAIALLVGVLAVVAVLGLAIRQLGDQATIAKARTEEFRVKLNYDMLVSELGEIKETMPNPPQANDPRVLEIQDAVNKLKTFNQEVQNKAQNSVQGAPSNDALDILNKVTACVVDPLSPDEGSPSQAKAIYVTVKGRIPLAADTSGVLVTSDKGDSGQINGCAGCTTPFSWTGHISLTANDPSLGGKTTTIQVTGPSLACNPVTFKWKFEPPKAVLTKSPTTKIQPGAKVILKWFTQNAQSADINGVAVDTLPNGVKEVAPNETTEYILTARSQNAGTEVTATSKQTVEVDKGPINVSITSPGGNSQVTATSVTVTGKVSPAPSPGQTMTAAISVNGAVKVNGVPVDAAGNFSSAVDLAKTTARNNFLLSTPNLPVNSCGPKAQAIFALNTSSVADVTNVIGVTVTGGSQPATASVTVFHAVLVSTFKVTWTSCDDLPNPGSPGVTLGAGMTAEVGTVLCGCNNAPNGCHASCNVTVSVNTTPLGEVPRAGVWTFNVAGPCP